MPPASTTPAYKRPTGAFACPKCNRVFDRKDNLQRHLNNQLKNNTDCSKNTTQTTEYTCVHLLYRLLTTLRGPLRIDEHVANDPAHVVPVLQDIWHAVTTVAHVHPERRFELLMQLLDTSLSANAQLRALNPHVGDALRARVACGLPTEVMRPALRMMHVHVGGVSSFGYAGTIAHAALCSAP